MTTRLHNMDTPLTITPEQLHDLQHSGAPLTVLDVRWRKDRPEGLPEYLSGHIPGALFADLEYELSDPSRAPQEGNHPLPSAEAFQETLRRWGVRPEHTVVLYDDLKNLSSARAWWLLRHAGLQDVRILDGSLRAWTSAGHRLSTEMEFAEPSGISISLGHLPTAGIEEIAGLEPDQPLIDARPASRYAGQDDPLAERSGHIPGALSAPAAANTDPEGRLLPAEQIRERYRALGVGPGSRVHLYCHSGIHSAHSALALSAAGYEPVLYPGGYGQWSRSRDRPVER